MRASWALCLVVGCGRFDFATTARGDAGTSVDADAPADAGNCPSFALFCDGFESGDLSKWDGQDLPANQLVDATAAHTGVFGLDSSVPNGMGAGAAGDTYVGVTVAAPMLAVREYVYSSAPLINYIGTMFLYEGVAMNGPYTEVDMNDVSQWEFSESDAGLKDHPGSILAQQSTWTCVEMDIDLTGGGTGSLYIEDQLAVSTAYVEGAPVYDHVAVGVTRANAGGFEVYVDDIVIATQHIGC